MVTVTRNIGDYTIKAQSPTIYSRVLRSVVYRNLLAGLKGTDLESLPPVLGQLATEYITLMPIIVASADNPSWVATESMNAEQTAKAFYEWITLPEAHYNDLNDLYEIVTKPANESHLTPEGKPENPTN